MLTSFWRVIKFSLLDLGRNFSLACMTILVLTLLLISVNTLLGVRLITQAGIKVIKQKIDLSIYLKPSVTNNEIKILEEKIKSIPEVKNVRLTSREQALEDFKAQYQDQPEIIAALSEVGDNPLGPAFVVKTDDPKDYEKIVLLISKPEYANLIEDKTFADTQTAIENITNITARIQEFALAISFLFGLIAVTIVYTTFRVAIYTERLEIGIKKLVGANNWFIRGPYLIEAIILSTISLGISLGAMWTATRTVDPYFAPLLGQANLLTNYLSSHILLVAGFEYVVVLFLTIFTSAMAMRQYLKA